MLMLMMTIRKILPELGLRAVKSRQEHIGRPTIIHVVDVAAVDDNKEDLA